ncbi:hypothetical protein P7K49_023132 [Saguinus oedipus]|uniref:Uncharacterized protein n=1 Tax=Saguinus oedipus TaxID=9490 RepID=A0ABQ9UKR5_SAGOE|nr:hypothetical protein P7K49_023132 [Saguinus oedipus]
MPPSHEPRPRMPHLSPQVCSVAVTHTFQIAKARSQLGYAPDKFSLAEVVERYPAALQLHGADASAAAARTAAAPRLARPGPALPRPAASTCRHEAPLTVHRPPPARVGPAAPLPSPSSLGWYQPLPRLLGFSAPPLRLLNPGHAPEPPSRPSLAARVLAVSLTTPRPCLAPSCVLAPPLSRPTLRSGHAPAAPPES